MDTRPTLSPRTSSSTSQIGVHRFSPPRSSPSTVKARWLSNHRQACTDFRARWGRGCLAALAYVWFICLTVGFVLLCLFASTSRGIADSNAACLPDDSFSVDPAEYRYWSKSGFFQITLGFGSLTFTQAKAVDVIWDVVSIARLLHG
jgi:hypothetical protein